METHPAPNDSRVQIVEVPARKVNVHPDSGSWFEGKYKKNLVEFNAALERFELSPEIEWHNPIDS